MSERKVLNKYYPPDFDPSKIPRLKLARDRQYVVRLMAPCNMKCTTCGEYIYKGKKFNARKETVQNQDYLGIKIFRFYIRCPRCLAEITFKTNPKDADYDLEHGATRNFQALQTAEKLEEQARIAEEEDEKSNPMKLLEKRTMQSRLEMERIEALEELKELNERQANVDFETMLTQNHDAVRETEEEREEREEREIQNEVEDMLKAKGIEKRGDMIIKRVKELDSDEEEERRAKIPKEDILAKLPQSSLKSKLSSLVRVKAKVEKNVEVKEEVKSSGVVSVNAGGSGSSSGINGGLGLVMAYSDSDSASN